MSKILKAWFSAFTTHYLESEVHEDVDLVFKVLNVKSNGILTFQEIINGFKEYYDGTLFGDDLWALY